MKIAYVLSSDIARFRGSTFKVKNQADEWRRQGADVKIFSMTPDSAPALLETVRFVKRKNVLLDKLLPYEELLQEVDRYHPDIIYFRYSLPNATFKALQKRYPSVIEINTDDKKEYKKLYYERRGIKNLILWLMNSVLRVSFLKRADGLVSVTKEIAEKKAFSLYNSTIAVIPNSISLDQSILKTKSSGKKPVKLFFIGSPGLNWHGLDKLLWIADALKDLIEAHIVGVDGQDTDNVFWHGYLEEKKYLEILSRCHICVGTLSLHNIGLTEACPLKVREYLKYGFPAILGYKDTAFLTDTPPWILEIPDTEELEYTSETVENIRNFCIAYKDYIVSAKEAEPYISSKIIEARRLDFMGKVIRQSNPLS